MPKKLVTCHADWQFHLKDARSPVQVGAAHTEVPICAALVFSRCDVRCECYGAVHWRFDDRARSAGTQGPIQPLCWAAHASASGKSRWRLRADQRFGGTGAP